MYQLKRRGPVAYEDLLREMEVIERSLLADNGDVAMDLMVLEAKLRERFHKMERQMAMQNPSESDLYLGEDLNFSSSTSLVPTELPPFPTMEEIETERGKKKTMETVGLAAALTLITGLGIFGLASILQIVLSWIA